MADVTVQLLGDFRVTVDGTTIDAAAFARRSGADLVQLLALASGHRRHREQVFDALWPDATIEQAANRLYQAASHARRALGSSDAVVLRDEMVALFPDRPIRVDAHIVEAASLDDRESVVAALEAWGGELLADNPYAEWTGEARDRLHRRYSELLAGTARWRTLAELDPANEEAAVALMRQDIELGHPEEALRRFGELERVLTAEMGASPGPGALAARTDASAALRRPGERPGPPIGLRAFVVVDTDTMFGPAPEADDYSAMAEAVEAVGGEVYERSGDGLRAVFGSAVDAVAGAVACQRAVQRRSDDGVRPRPSIRLGVDVGDAERATDSWTGSVVERAAAIAAAGSSGQIVCSTLVTELAGPDMADDTQVTDLGLFRLPDHPPVRLARVVAEDLEDRRAPLRVGRLAGRLVTTVAEPLFGRDDELDFLAREMELTRLVTVVGAGGAGKTHLARHVALRCSARHPGGVWLAELGSVSDPGGAAAEVLAAVGGQRHTDTTEVESIVRTVGDRSMLLVLDNCEHVLEGIGPLGETLVERCPEIRILATSREPLGIAGEVVVPLGELDRAAAIELFCAEARRHGSEIDPADPVVERICQRLDDLPLALRLAAARARALDLSEIEQLLVERLDAFRSSERSGAAHHRTLRSAIAWSADALDHGPRGVLVDLSTLANRFTLDAAIAVATREGMTRGEVLDHFDELVRRSLVSGPGRTAEQPRYRLLESVRLYTRELTGDNDAADRHLEYFASRVEDSAAMVRDQPDAALRRFDSDWDDVRRARLHALARGRTGDVIRLLAGVAFPASTRLRFEYLDWCEESLADQDDGTPLMVTTAAQARALGAWAHLVILRGDVRRAIGIAEAAHESAPEDEMVLYALGFGHLWVSTDREMTRRFFERLVEDRSGTAGTRRATALAILTISAVRSGGDPSGYLHQLEVLAARGGEHYRGHLEQARGYALMDHDPDAALEAFEQSVAICEANDRGHAAANTRDAIAELLGRVGTIQQGLEATRQALIWYVERGMWTMAMNRVASATTVLERAERDDIATTLLSAYQASPFQSATWFERLRRDRARLAERNPAHFDTWWETGERLDSPTACTLALATIEGLLADG